MKSSMYLLSIWYDSESMLQDIKHVTLYDSLWPALEHKDILVQELSDEDSIIIEEIGTHGENLELDGYVEFFHIREIRRDQI